ncbi:MAG TPA: cupin domain-containing protein [Bacillales bacterium]|nr:cupin domain-containing protein [Bacillales bacterium]
MVIKNIREAQAFDVNRIKKKTLFREKKSTAFVVNLMPGQVLPAHRHPGGHIYLLLLEGEGECCVDGESNKLSWRDVLHCRGDEEISLKNTGKKLMSIYVVLACEEM